MLPMLKNTRIYLDKIFIVLLFICQAIAFIGCQSHKMERPEISDEKIAGILLDINIAEATQMIQGRAFEQSIENIKDKNAMAKKYKSIFEQHQIKAETFYNAITWYQQNPKAFFHVYEIMLPKIDSLKLQLPEVKG
jgi:hypothetical protein